MFLSKVWIDWRWAKDPYQLHRALWQLFPHRPNDARDFLFRIEAQHFGRGAEALLQSVQAPSSAQAAQVIVSKPIQWSIPNGAKLRFKLRANPIKTIKDGEQRRDRNGKIKGCRVPLIHEEEQLQWLSRKLAGAALLSTAWVTPESPIYFYKDDIRGKIQPICFEGQIIVQENESFITLLSQGIGPAKAMGCGLLSLGLS
ncbi:MULTISPECIES: type I-E CRISPR-associated protein Cas6/Cse3/CasE [Xenorhabdus]|uniref:CRISPR system Cascade subunit CasE n=1 Tax=Xenorhabdus ehlersii TaxID=290111 RepID=A0A2D0IPQ4_9GAMM|nr:MULTISPECIES: type I-E CRISPR-associated protein Cas6/Cse3/CasE [Xenorhabdus]MBC8951111.1 type I-E CRISPR-associated protein Cas6/Cse3/CasE [Xenorhabdus sp. TS4]PHM23800.1 type I-E CRISPR-associated protein Cas6/Cse3/CasE [Xenorhabdus ehlersii]RKE89234.1 CRISPR system Cascade subunit CasE [Xenorhabdus ehlersii]